jgi:hypothetical protein
MKIERGFRIPEPRDRCIQWPARQRDDDPTIAIYRPAIRAWSVPGVERAWGSADELVRNYGNDWVRMILDIAPEVSK